MNINNVLKYTLKLSESESDNKKIIQEIIKIKSDLEVARNIFNNVNDPDLIEAAIFLESAAKKRYNYYLIMAKQKGVTVSGSYIAGNCATSEP